MTIDYSKWDKFSDDDSLEDNTKQEKSKAGEQCCIDVHDISSDGPKLLDIIYGNFTLYQGAFNTSMFDTAGTEKDSIETLYCGPIDQSMKYYLEQYNPEEDKAIEEHGGKPLSKHLLLKDLREGHRRGTVMINGVKMMSAKDVFSSPMILARLIDGIAELRQDILSGKVLKDVRNGLYDCPCSTYIWELAIKLRVDASQALDVMNNTAIPGLKIDFLEYVLKVLAEFNLIKLGLEKILHENGRLVEFMYPSFIIMNTLSATMEFCRYRSGCVYTAKHKTFLDVLLNLPLHHIFQLQQKYCMKLYADFNGRYQKAIMFGMIEQACDLLDWPML